LIERPRIHAIGEEYLLMTMHGAFLDLPGVAEV
jgi:hypothetical protein